MALGADHAIEGQAHQLSHLTSISQAVKVKRGAVLTAILQACDDDPGAGTRREEEAGLEDGEDGENEGALH